MRADTRALRLIGRSTALLRRAFGVTLVAVLAACSDDRSAPGDAAVADSAAIVDTETPQDLAAVVERLMPSLERISGLDRRETLSVRRQTREGARAYVARQLNERMPPAEREAVRRTYVALGLLPDTLDLESLLLDLYTEQVLGYYDPGERTLFVVSGADVADLEPVIAHELVHALQDQHTDLDSLIAGERGNDRQTAAHAAMEGHAMLVMFTVLAEHASGRTVDPTSLPNPAIELAQAMEAQNSEFPVFRSAPAVVRETLLFPYLRGVDFVHTLWRARRPLSRYPAPLDSLLPQSTEQVLHPEEHFIRRRDEPVPVALDDVPAGWSVVHEDGLGELETAIFLEQHLGASARAAAAGWGGDRYRLLTDAAGGDVLYWLSVWDSRDAADRFAAAVQRAAGQRTGRQVAVQQEDLAGHAAVRVIDSPAGRDIRSLLSN